MATYWTLVYGATEKSFQEWGFTDPHLRLISEGQSVFTVGVPGSANLVAAPPIPFEGAVTIYRNRTYAAGVGSGGEVVFKGKQVTRRSSANSDSPADTLTFGDAWYDLERLVFQQQWQHNAGPATDYFSRLNLFQRYDAVTGVSAATNGTNIVNITLAAPVTLTTGDYVTILGLAGIAAPKQVTVVDATHFNVPGQLTSAYTSGGQVWPLNKRITNGAQIQEIINFANGCGVAIQAGTIDLAYTLPIYPVKAVSCATAIQVCIKPQPDAVTWIDYTTTPPTFNCRARANLTAVNLPYADGGRHATSDIIPRYDLQPSAVVLQYQKISTTGSGAFTDFSTDAYPALSTGRTVRALVVPIDLRGANIQNLTEFVVASAMPNLPAGDPGSLLWWAQKKPELQGVTSLAFVSGSLSVKDDNGNDYTTVGTGGLQAWQSSLPNEYKKGEILSWMGVNVVQMTIKGTFTYVDKDSAGRNLHSVKHVISTRVKLTNAPAGQTAYSALQSLDPGETAPAGLAQQIYTTLSVLQYEGSHVIIDPGINTTSALVGPKNKLELTGGAAAWTTMDATIQVVDFDFFLNKVTVSFGPAKHIAPGDLEELLQFWRFRTIYDNPNLRISGVQSQTQGAQVGGDTAMENTTPGNAQHSLHTIQAGADSSTMRIQHDAGEAIIRMRYEDASGSALTSQPAIYLSLGDIDPDGTPRIAKFRWLQWKDPLDCSSWKALVLMTAPETA